MECICVGMVPFHNIVCGLQTSKKDSAKKQLIGGSPTLLLLLHLLVQDFAFPQYTYTHPHHTSQQGCLLAISSEIIDKDQHTDNNCKRAKEKVEKISIAHYQE